MTGETRERDMQKVGAEMRVAVAGGTGVTGQQVVPALIAAGHDPVILSRSQGVDLTTGNGLDDILEGCAALIDVTNVTTTRRDVAASFFASATRHLLASGARVGIRHHVCLSIIGIDRIKYGYYQGKLLQEELVKAAGVPWTILRASPFHEFADNVLGRMRGPIALVPRMRLQPIAVREVAAALVALVSAPPLGGVTELAGPREEELVDMVRRVVRARGQRRLVVPFQAPGVTGRAFADGAQLATDPGPRGSRTFTEWLAAEGRQS
jgi:uncharacterized protein YbjT (DUF2867 family)